jgi:hypothetical protein
MNMIYGPPGSFFYFLNEKNYTANKCNILDLIAPEKLFHHVFEFLAIYAEVVTFVAGSLEAGGLPGSLEIPDVLK